MKSKFFVPILLLGLLAVSFACNKDDDDNQPAVSEAEFEIQFRVGDQDFQLGETYNLGNTLMAFDVAQFYLGGIRFMPEEGEMIRVEDKYLLVKAGQTTYPVTELDNGHYHMTMFFVGVDPQANSQSGDDFTSRPADDPLSEQVPSMHWNWNTGYKFTRFDGRYDSNQDGLVDDQDEGFTMHLGNDENLTEFSFVVHKDMEGGTEPLAFTVDVEQLFAGIDIPATPKFHTTPDQTALIETYVNNLKQSITFGHE